MSAEESERTQRRRKGAARRAAWSEQRAEDQETDKKADDANVQTMIERSIRDHGA